MYGVLSSLAGLSLLAFFGLLGYFSYLKVNKKSVSDKLGWFGQNKKATLALVFVVMLIFGGLANATPEGQELAKKREAEKALSSQQKVENKEAEEKAKKEAALKAEAEKKIQDEARASEEIQKSELYRVVSATDGDTITINYNGANEKVRLVGLDTPETKDPRKPVQCFGQEASTKMSELVSGKKVRIEFDSTQGQRDKYGRLLLFVFLEDGRNLAYEMISGGYGTEYTYNSNPYKYQSQFKRAQNEARENKRGLWANNTCAGDPTKPVNSAPATQTSPALQSQTGSGECDIKGNINKKGEKIYHVPGGTSYEKTNPEQIFCSEAEAQSAGFRRALR